MDKEHRERLLDVERRILVADERLTAAQNLLDDAKARGLATPEMQVSVQLMDESLAAMRTYRDLVLSAVRSLAENQPASD
jgi:hypothetical protein